MTEVNGVSVHRRSLSDGGVSTQAWKILSQTLPSRDPNADAWWQLTGRHLALLLDAAGYPIERQYECLLYHYHYAAPYLGPAPRASGSATQWKSMLQLDGTPFEFSWKWNTAGGEPDVRIGLEPIGPMAGTALDPLNHLAIREVLHKLSSAVPGAELTWTHHFLATLFDHDYAKYVQEAATGALIGTSLIFSLEFLRNSTGIKTYFQPRMLNQHGFLDIPRWEASFQSLHPDAPSRLALHEFMASSPEGKLLKPFCLSVDNCDPAKARLKWYFNSPHTNFTAIREIMTLGGRIPNTVAREKQFSELFDLLKTLTGQSPAFPEDSEFPFISTNSDNDLNNFAEMPDMLKGCVYFFDIAPGKSLPAIKIYFPVRNHCRNDLTATQNLIQWLDSRGRGEFGPAFLRALEAVADYRRLDEGGGLQSFVSCQFKSNGDLDLTSYFNPEAFHSARLTHRRSTRRRGDW
ncbi:tryptophan dimethylallyltransferase-domain-containing protein [Aspergillus lucknowensis]|uniref:Tryptophan dimethylallyltransferase-domain-containing protein n=1 Tax=Aspergillus lucknowensis TaxID=176173 RepID=A0ABR4LFN6_9EURO